MFEMDKESFGQFLAQHRKEQGMTQKQLAERLFVSDKAVSKWERGLSLPDVSLLLPLSQLLGESGRDQIAWCSTSCFTICAVL